MGFLLGTTGREAGIGDDREVGWGKDGHEDRGDRRRSVGELVVRLASQRLTPVAAPSLVLIGANPG